jgi:hypothetical protein
LIKDSKPKTDECISFVPFDDRYVNSSVSGSSALS